MFQLLLIVALISLPNQQAQTQKPLASSQPITPPAQPPPAQTTPEPIPQQTPQSTTNSPETKALSTKSQAPVYFHNNNKNYVIQGVTNIVSCSTIVCQKIKQFTIAENIQIDCYDKFLPINFDIMDPVAKKNINAFGFVPESKSFDCDGIQTVSEQEYHQFCKKIKR